MARGSTVAVAALFGLLVGGGPLQAQWVAGVHRSASPAADGGGSGFGARGGVQFGPLALMAVADWYRPRCLEAGVECHDRALALHGSMEVPAPLLRPYLVAGMGVRDRAPLPNERRRSTLLGFGLRAGVIGFDLFGELTGERMADHDTRLVLRAGVRF